ncbi:MAG: dihydrofolate reductase, partial [Subtercola sp.]|nr:dihydrofolate reductase [Subtercola sp.]
LPGRRNLVLTRNAGWTAEGAERVASLDAAVTTVGAGGDGTTLWVIGGGELYRLAMASPLSTRLEVTELDLGVKGDTLAPAIDVSWERVAGTPWLESRTGIRYRFVTYAR